MPFTGYVDSDHLTVLSSILDDFCKEKGVGPGVYRDAAALKILALFNSGVTDPEELRASLRHRAPTWRASTFNGEDAVPDA